MRFLVTALSPHVHVEDFELGRVAHSLIVRYRMIVNGFLGNAGDLMKFAYLLSSCHIKVHDHGI
jgi:hypothetical protein